MFCPSVCPALARTKTRGRNSPRTACRPSWAAATASRARPTSGRWDAACSSRSASAPGKGGCTSRSITSNGKPALRPMALFRRATALNSPSRARTRASRLSDSCTSARSTSSRRATPPLAPSHRIVQDRLGPADGVLLHPAGRAGQEDVQVGGGDVELHGLVGPGELEFGDALAPDRLAVLAAGPPEVVQGPLEPQLGLRVAPGPGAVRQDESLVPWYARS